MKNLISFFIAIIITFSLSAQNKVAVFDPVDDANTDMIELIREVFSTGITNSGKYKPVERAMIEQVLQENKYQAEGQVDASQVSELGRQMGADYVCVSIIKKAGTNYFITAKLVSVKTATVELQQYIKTEDGINDLFEKVEELSVKLFGGNNSTKKVENNNSNNNSTNNNNELEWVGINSDKIFVYPEDLPGKYTWQASKDACENLSGHGYDDWYLPNKTELGLLLDNKKRFNMGTDYINYTYWCNEYDKAIIGQRKIGYNAFNRMTKNFSYRCRCVRKD